MEKTLILLILLANSARAQTVIQKKVSQLPQLQKLIKLTVGPDDNYQVDVTDNEEQIIFTRKSNLSTRLYVQSTTSNNEKLVLDDRADANNAVYQPDNKKIAFVYYKENSRGDLCLLDNYESHKPHCFNLNGEIESPQWMDDNQILYVNKKLNSDDSGLQKIDIHSLAVNTIDRGNIWSPVFDHNNKLLAYNKEIDGVSRLVLKNLGSRELVILKVDLPGASGFPSFSPDGKWLYFSHYFSDSNDDQKIDANDNSIIFRANVKQLLAGQYLVPQQITSGEQNCSFPKAKNKFLYVTCDFEGSLDVYRLSPDGLIPATWSVSMIESAHRTSRNYHQRIMLLNQLLYKGQFSQAKQYMQKLFSNFLLNDDTLAAAYYLNRLAELSVDKTERQQWQAIDYYLQARTLQKQLLSQKINEKFKQNVYNFISHLNETNVSAQIVQAILYTFVGQYRRAENLLPRITKLKLSGVNHFLYDILINSLCGRTTVKATKLFKFYEPLLREVSISAESKIYYAYNYLVQLQKRESKENRVNFLYQQMKQLKEIKSVFTLFAAEIATLKIILEKSDKNKRNEYRELDNLMSLTRTDYFTKKALYVRAIENFVAADEVQYLTYVATNWLRYTEKSDTEFAYAREIYIDKVLERAYMNFSQTKINYASGNFFSAVGLTDNLETHFGYIKTMNLLGRSTELTANYKSMNDRKVIVDNIYYVNSLLLLSKILPELGLQKLEALSIKE
ncbi:MAG: PD40 domain-containing protein, partial [Bdellovibrionales bacterium]|nr:PD40 domain-containing protein [Bdellovibrionales bacterium]